MPRHILTAWDITYVAEGRAQYSIDEEEYNLTAGDLICLPPRTRREGVTVPDHLMQCFSVNFRLTNLKGENVRLPFPIQSHIGLAKDVIHLFHDLSFVWLDKQPGYALKTRGIFLLILHRLFELASSIPSGSGETDARIQKITRYIAKHYAERILVKNMAALVGLHTGYFGALFHQETGVTMNQYIIRTRVRNAENMLRSGEYKVKEVAEACGYCDDLHFFKQFKAVMGMPPSACIPKRNN
jgi:AraC-like DNA-binding protein